jgi:hypothetical protein
MWRRFLAWARGNAVTIALTPERRLALERYESRYGGNRDYVR